MKNIVVPVLGAISIISTGTAAWLLAMPPATDPRMAKLEGELQEAKRTVSQLKAEKAALAQKLARQPPVVAGQSTVNPDAPVGDEVPGEETPTGVRNSGNMQQLLSSPAMREVIDKQQAAQIEVGYNKLFEELGLDNEERQNLKDILNARRKAETDLGLQLMAPDLTQPQREAILEEARRQRSIYQASIRNFLNNPSDYNKFQQWDESLPERSTFDAIGRGLFEASGEPLSNQQETQLISLMSEVRRSPYSIGGLNDQTGADPSKLTNEVIQAQLQQLDSNHRIIQERAQAFLSPTQQRTLKTYLDQVKTISQSSIELFKNGNG